MCSGVISKLKAQWERWAQSATIAFLLTIIGLFFGVFQWWSNDTPESIDALRTSQMDNQDAVRADLDKIYSEIVSTGVPTRNQLKAILSEAKNDLNGLTPHVLRRHFHRQFSAVFRGNSVSYHRALALAHFENSQLAEAFDTLTEGLKTTPSDPALLYEQALTSIFMGKFLNAEKQFISARSALLTINPPEYPAMLSVQLALATLAEYHGHHAKALDMYKAVATAMELERVTETFDFLILNKLNDGVAIRLSTLPDPYENYVLQAKYFKALVINHEFESAFNVINKWFTDKIPPDVMDPSEVASTRLGFASILLLNGKITEAKKQFNIVRQIIQLPIAGVEPSIDQVTLIYVHGLIHMYEERIPQAEAHFKRVLYYQDTYNVALDILPVLHARTSTALALGDISKAVESQQRMEDLAIERKDPRGRFDAAAGLCLIGFITKNSGEVERSIDTMQETYAASDSFSEADRGFLFFCRGLLANLAGDAEAEARLDEKALKIFEHSFFRHQSSIELMRKSVEEQRNEAIDSSRIFEKDQES